MSEVEPFYNFEKHIPKLREVIGKGLTAGVGEPEAGALCVEAAVCLVLGLPHGDEAPSCVGAPDRVFAIWLNDAPWSSNEARAAGMADFAIAHLGSATMTPAARVVWLNYLSEQTIRRVVPIALRACGLEKEAERCEREGTKEAAAAAAAAAYAADAAAADSAAAYAAAVYANAAYAANAANAAADAAAAANAAYAADAAAAAADSVLTLSATIAVEAYAKAKEVTS